jgi:tetratricopeptide (TPR) repeat protein
VDKNIVIDFFQNQQFEEALSYLAPAVSIDSNNINLLAWMGYGSYMTDDKVAAENYYQRIVRLDSNNVPALYYLVRLNKDDAHVIAMGYAARLIALQPEKPLWWRTMGDLFRRSNEVDSAIYFHDRAYELTPTDYRNIVALADDLIEKKEYHQADSILDIGLARDSMNLSLLRSRVHSAYLSQDYAAAIVPGERIVRQNQPILNAVTWLALSYYNLKMYNECVGACEYMLSNGFDVEAIYYYEARAYAKLKEYKKSNELLGICLKKAISHTAEWYYNDLAENDESLKNYRSAIAHSDTAYYLFKDPLMLYNCGRISESLLKNESMARKYYRQYLSVAHPASAEEQKAYNYVRRRWGATTSRNNRVSTHPGPR